MPFATSAWTAGRNGGRFPMIDNTTYKIMLIRVKTPVSMARALIAYLERMGLAYRIEQYEEEKKC
jgi:hypothetical protein